MIRLGLISVGARVEWTGGEGLYGRPTDGCRPNLISTPG